MRFYNQQPKYYCGIDLHARQMYVCILDQKGKTHVHKNIKTDLMLLFELIFPYIDDIGLYVPKSPSPLATALPIPELAPVTRAFCLFKIFSVEQFGITTFGSLSGVADCMISSCKI